MLLDVTAKHVVIHRHIFLIWWHFVSAF